jgi:peptidoglycan/xylan/chitin deacetylase (PgdA/CDA1 family)
MSRLNSILSNWFKRKRPPLLILLYHRVADVQTDPQLLAVSTQNFAQQMEMLRNNFSLIHLSDIKALLEQGNLNHPTVAVTFDDGYADNLHQARPLLERYEVPATIFVTTDYVKNPREFWWDELESIFLLSGDLKATLEIEDVDRLRWDLNASRSYTPENFQKFRSWDVTQDQVPTVRQEIYRSLCNILRPLSENQRGKILSKLREWAGTNSTPRESHRPMSVQEVSSLGKDQLIHIGAHTRTHSVLSALSLEDQFTEIKQSKADLEEITGEPIQSFAYPFGTESDYTSETVKLVKKAGFENACSNFEPETDTRFDFYQMPRFVIRNWDGDQFMQHLRSKLG